MFELTIPLRLIIVTVVVASIVLSIMNYVITSNSNPNDDQHCVLPPILPQVDILTKR